MAAIKKKILLDLDGVLNTYTKDFNPNLIPPIKDGAVEFLKQLSKDYEIVLFTVRDKILAEKWIAQNNLQKYITGVTNIKEPAWLIVDDRCICFNGAYDKLLDDIDAFKVWHSA